jgi:O-antigen ligase
MGFYASLGFMFFRFSEAHQILSFALGFNTFILYLFGLPAIAAVLMSGGLRRAFSFKCGWYWLGYLVWLVLCIPFSHWPGGSFGSVLNYMRTAWLTFFLIAGLVMTWKECWILINMLAVSGVIAVVSGKVFAIRAANSRVGLAFGTYANANDFAALLILMCPFLALVVLTPKRNLILRAISFLALMYGLYLVLATGSRGGMVAIAVTAVYILAKVSMRVRVVALLGFGLAATILFTVLPSAIRTRLTTVFENTDVGASESATIRRELFKFAVVDTFTHPLFGVGPNQFGNYTGDQTHHQNGTDSAGLWFETHNTYLQVSAENGIPAFVFFCCALVSTFRLLNRTYKRTAGAGAVKEVKKLHLAAFCMLVSMIGFCIAVFFLSFAYHFHLPAMTGIAMVLATAAEQEFGISLNPASIRPGLRRDLDHTKFEI